MFCVFVNISAFVRVYSVKCVHLKKQ